MEKRKYRTDEERGIIAKGGKRPPNPPGPPKMQPRPPSPPHIVSHHAVVYLNGRRIGTMTNIHTKRDGSVEADFDIADGVL